MRSPPLAKIKLINSIARHVSIYAFRAVLVRKTLKNKKSKHSAHLKLENKNLKLENGQEPTEGLRYFLRNANKKADAICIRFLCTAVWAKLAPER